MFEHASERGRESGGVLWRQLRKVEASSDELDVLNGARGGVQHSRPSNIVCTDR